MLIGIAFQFEPIVQEGHEDMVHHIILYACSSTVIDPTFNGEGYPCFRADSNTADIPIELPTRPLDCNTWIASWAKGGEVCKINDSDTYRWYLFYHVLLSFIYMYVAYTWPLNCTCSLNGRTSLLHSSHVTNGSRSQWLSVCGSNNFTHRDLTLCLGLLRD